MTKNLSVIFLVVVTLLLTTIAWAGSQTHDFYVGEIDADKVLKDAHFDKSYQAFVLTDDELLTANSWGSNVQIDVFFGMWCHDSVREVPRLIKLLEQNSKVKVNLYALDIQKSDDKGLAKKYHVKYTPTMIVYADDKEVGRIIERPEQSIVSDINRMLIN